MKKIVSTILLLSLASATIFAGEEPKEKPASSPWLKVSVDLPFALFGGFLGKAEFKISDDMSILANAAYLDTRASINSDVNSFTFGTDNVVAVKLGFGGRWYLMGGGCMKGLYIEDLVDLDIVWTLSGNSIPFGGGTFGPLATSLHNSFHIGYSWVTDIGFFVDAAAGIHQYAVLSGTVGVPLPHFYLENGGSMNSVEARLAVGWAF